MMKCIITGTSGFIGGALSAYLQSQGHEVICLERKKTQKKNALYFELGKKIPTHIFHHADVFIHCAYDFNLASLEKIKEVNVEGSIALFQAALSQGVKKNIFISSISAFEESRSMYGQAKYGVEKFLKNKECTIIRPGLVWGDEEKGMFGSLSKIARFPILPIFDQGKQKMFLIHINDLVKIVDFVIKNFDKMSNSVITAAHPKGILFKDILKILRKKRGYDKTIFVSIPSKISILILRALEGINIKFPFKSDNLVGLINSNPNPDFTSLKSFNTRLEHILDISKS